jgi:hypothetical protein
MHFKTWLHIAQLSVTILALALFANAARVAQAAGFDFSEDFSTFGRQPNNLICLPGTACGAVACRAGDLVPDSKKGV